MSVFDPIGHGGLVEQAAAARLEEWLPTFLHEIERQNELNEGSLKIPESISFASEFTTFPEEQTPAIVIVVPGIPARPTKEGGKTYTVAWSLSVYVSVSAKTQADTRRNAYLYIAAIRATLLHKPSLGAGFKGIDWLSEDYTPIDSDKRRSLAGASAAFSVQRDEVATVGGGPVNPEPVPEDWPEVTVADATVETKED